MSKPMLLKGQLCFSNSYINVVALFLKHYAAQIECLSYLIQALIIIIVLQSWQFEVQLEKS